jgi:hypothetical protein
MLFPRGLKRPERETDQQSLSSAEVDDDDVAISIQ